VRPTSGSGAPLLSYTQQSGSGQPLPSSEQDGGGKHDLRACIVRFTTCGLEGALNIVSNACIEGEGVVHIAKHRLRSNCQDAEHNCANNRYGGEVNLRFERRRSVAVSKDSMDVCLCPIARKEEVEQSVKDQ
jgi:hypothetical protein